MTTAVITAFSGPSVQIGFTSAAKFLLKRKGTGAEVTKRPSSE